MRKVKRKRKIIKMIAAAASIAFVIFVALLWHFWDYNKKYTLAVSTDHPLTMIYIDDEKMAMFGDKETKIRIRKGEHTLRLLKEIDELNVYEVEKTFDMPKQTFVIYAALEKRLTPLGKQKRQEKEEREKKRAYEARQQKLLQKRQQAENEKKAALNRAYKLKIQKKRQQKGQKNWNQTFAKDHKGVYRDHKHHLAWYNTHKAQNLLLNYKEAKKMCLELKVGTLTQWVLPNKTELIQSANYQKELGLKKGLTWSSNAIGKGNYFAFATDVIARKSQRSATSNRHQVRCVISAESILEDK